MTNEPNATARESGQARGVIGEQQHVVVEDGDVGMAATRGETGPAVTVRLEPHGAGQPLEINLSPHDARRAADRLRQTADTAQRSSWTPALIAHVREYYVPGGTDQEIIAVLDGLAERLGASPSGPNDTTLSETAAGALAADRRRELTVAAVDAFDLANEQLVQLHHALAGLRRLDRVPR